AINTKIREKLPKVIKTEHAEVEQMIWDELYPNVITDTENTTNLLTKLNTYFDYDLTFWKQGRTIHVKGDFRNQSGAPLAGVDVATIADGQFRPLGSTRIMLTNNSGNSAQLLIQGDKIM